MKEIECKDVRLVKDREELQVYLSAVMKLCVS